MKTKRADKPRKKSYLKPELVTVSLTPDEAVLGNCKMAGTHGPGMGQCNVPTVCFAQGS